MLSLSPSKATKGKPFYSFDGWDVAAAVDGGKTLLSFSSFVLCVHCMALATRKVQCSHFLLVTEASTSQCVETNL